MPRKYDTQFKSMITNLIVNEKHSTSLTARQFNIPLKTVEKWITAYNKDNTIFDEKTITVTSQIESLKKRLTELEKEKEIIKKSIAALKKK